jgi:hypothetical protein
MAYPGIWSGNLSSDEEKQAFQDLMGVNNKVLDRLKQMCYNMINELEDKSSDFDTPNWALRQANLIGQEKSLKKIIQLCTSTTEGVTPA